jgi:replicative DNA helicase
VLAEIGRDLDPGLEAGIMGRLVSADAASKLIKIVEQFQEGDEIDLLAALRTIQDQFERDLDRKVRTPWVQDDIVDLLGDTQNDRGFHWRIPALNLGLRPLVGGDFLITAARPDVGKTSFNTDQLTYFAAQVDALYPGEGRTILWFNNEGPGKRIVTRCYQSALNATMSDLIKLSNAGTIHKDYNDVTGGRPNIIKVYDIHDFWQWEVEEIIRAENPALILFDMIDNIKFGGDVNNNGQRTDQLLEAMYQWARVIGVKYDCVVMACSQVSADGENMQYPLLGMLKDSKTGKQGAADAILTIGYHSDYPNSRFLGFTKNKLLREGSPKKIQIETIFDSHRGRYNESAAPTGATN